MQTSVETTAVQQHKWTKTTGGTSATNCVPAHCEIVAYIYNDATKEVIQVEQEHVVGH